MISATDLKSGTTFLLDGQPHKVIKYTHQKIGRGGANVKVSLRNLKTHTLKDKTFTSTNRFEEITTLKRPLQFLYQSGDSAVFIDPQTFDQTELSLKLLGDDLSFLHEGQAVDVLFWESQPLSIELPPKVTLQVSQAAPGIKGNSASNIYKTATLENGLKLKVPLFIKAGDRVRLDTRTKEYLERVN